MLLALAIVIVILFCFVVGQGLILSPRLECGDAASASPVQAILLPQPPE